MLAALRGGAALALAGALVVAPSVAGCGVDLPEGKAWTVDTSAWSGTGQCPQPGCALDAYRSRDFTTEAAVPDALVSGATVQVHCFVPTPAPQVDPTGREARLWFLLTVDGSMLWAPDLALTADPDLRRAPSDPGDHLAAGLAVCHSAVPGR